MRFSQSRLLSQLILTRRVASLRLYTVCALPQVSPTLSDSEQQVDNVKLGNFDYNLLKSNKIGVLGVFNGTKDDPNLALSFLGELKQHGISLNVDAYATVIRILCYWGLERKLDSVLVELIGKEDEERGFSVLDLVTVIRETEDERRSLLLIRLVSALVKAYVSRRMFDEAIDVFFQSKRLECVPNIKACNFLMNHLIEAGKTDMVVALFRQLEQLGLCANGHTYAIVVKALCRKGDLEGAAKLLEAMTNSGETPSVFAYTTFIEGLCVNQMTDKAFVFLKALIDTKILVRADLRIAYSMVVRGFCNEMNIEAAEKVVLDMEENGINPDVYVCSAIIDRLCKNMNLPKALDFLDKMLGKGLKINFVIVSSILQCYCKMDRCLEAFHKFKEFRDMNIFLDRVCYNVAFDALSKLGRVEEAVELLRDMMGKGMVPDAINYTTLIGGYCLQGKVVDALDLMDEMREKGTSPDIITYTVLAGGFARNGHAKEALVIYETMKAEGLKPNTVTDNVIIESLCSARKIEEAEAFFMSLEQKPPENYASLVKGYCEAGLSELAFKLFIRLEFPLRKSVYFKLFTSLYNEGYLDKALMVLERMCSYGVEPGKTMYGKLISALCRSNNVIGAQLLFDTILGRGLIPDLFTYTIMIHTYCRLNDLQKAYNLFEDMKQRGIKPDVVTYTVLLDSQLKLDSEHNAGTGSVHGEMRKRNASEVWKEMTSVNIRPDVVCYTVLIDRQCKIQNLKMARKLFDQMMENGLEPDIVPYTALISGYCSKGYIGKAVTLVNEMSTKGISPTKPSQAAVKSAILRAKRFQSLE